MYKAVCLIFVVALALLVPGLALANQLDMFGFNARATGLANEYTALAEGPEATFYNPGALIESKQIMAFVGYSYTLPALTLDRQSRDGADASDTDEIKQARMPGAAQFISTGVSGGLFNRVYLGLGMQVPIDGLRREKIFSPNRPYFVDFDTNIFGLTFLPAVAVQLAPNYGLGVAARITVDSLGSFTTDVPIASGDYQAQTLSDSQFTGQASPIIGFYAKPFEFLRFGLTYFGQSYCYYHKTVSQKIDPSDPDSVVDIEYEAKYDFIPRRIAFGVAGVPDEHVTLTAGVDWVNWSAYEPPFAKTRIDFSQMADAGLDYTRPAILDVDEADFRDVFVPRFGIEVRPYKYLTLQAGYALDPSASPDQQGTTTILDSTMHVMSFGIAGNFGGPNGDLVKINFALMDHYMTERWASKSDSEMQEEDPTTNPAYPRFTARGHMLYSALTASFRF